jgi:hypothetical protein
MSENNTVKNLILGAAAVAAGPLSLLDRDAFAPSLHGGVSRDAVLREKTRRTCCERSVLYMVARDLCVLLELQCAGIARVRTGVASCCKPRNAEHAAGVRPRNGGRHYNGPA